MRRFLKITGIVAAAIAALVLLVYALFASGAVERFIRNKAVSMLQEQINGKVSIGDINIKFFNKIEVTDFAIVSKDSSESLQYLKETYGQSDTLLAVNKVTVKFSLTGLLESEILTINSAAAEGGVFNLQFEGDSTNIDRIFPKQPQTSKSSGNVAIGLKLLTLSNFRMTLNNPEKMAAPLEGVADFSNLKLSEMALEAKNILYRTDSITLRLEKLHAEEISGLTLGNLTGDVRIKNTIAEVKNFRLSDGHSNIRADYFSLGYNNIRTFKHFTDSVVFSTRLSSSVLDFSTLGHLSPSLKGSTLILNIDGTITGPVRRLTARRVSILSKTGQTNLLIPKAVVEGLPDAQKATLNVEIANLATNGPELSSLIAQLTSSGRIAFLDKISALHTYRYSGNLSGHFNRLTARGTLTEGTGKVDITATVNTSAKKSGELLSTNVNATAFNLGNVTGVNKLGSFTGGGKVRIQGGKNSVISIDSLRIKELMFNGYNFSNIFATGQYADDTFNGKVISHDPNLDLMFQGSASTNTKGDRKYNFYANVPYIDLQDLGLDNRYDFSELSASLHADFTQNDSNDIFGYLRVDNAVYTNPAGTYEIGNIELTSLRQDEKYIINLLSSFARARYEGDEMITRFIDKLYSGIICKHLGNVLETSPKADSLQSMRGANYAFTLQTFNTQGVFALIAPGAYLQSGTSLTARLTDNGHYNFALSSGRIAFENNYLKNVRLNIRDTDNGLAGYLFNKDATIAGIKVDSTMVRLTGADNQFNVGVKFHNDSTAYNTTNLNAEVTFVRDSSLHTGRQIHNLSKATNIHLYNSDITLKGAKWSFKPADIVLSEQLTYINGLEILNGMQSFKAGGLISKTVPDSLGISMDRFNIAIIDQFFDQPFQLQGLLSGSANLSLNKGNTNMFASFAGDSMYVHNTPVGQMQILGRYNSEEDRYNLLLRTQDKDVVKLTVSGYYRPEDSYLDVHSTLNGLSLAYFEPIMQSVVNNTGGSLNGDIRVYGPLDNLSVVGENCSFNNFKFTLDYTKVPYTLNGPIEISDGLIRFRNDKITDTKGGAGTLNGQLSHNAFKNIKLDASIALNNLLSLNTTEKDNEDFYGTAYASGNVKISGTPERMELNIQARTQPKTFLHIPVSGASKATKTNLLTFVRPVSQEFTDPYDTLFTDKKKNSRSPMELAVNMQITATPDADIWLEVDKTTGDIIKANGSGRVTLKVNPKKDMMDMSGNYVINSGSYHFVLMGLASRDFEVQQGSSITLNGDIQNTNLDITGIYKTKAAINRLISDTSSVSSMRNVSASIIIKGRLSNPQISFKIDIPDLDPTTKVKVESALNTEDKMQKQFAALLVSGGFIPDVESGVTSNSSLYSNASEILSGQLSNILSQLGIPLDLGFNYQPGSKNADNVFDVAVSTQLFNNRIVINGNIGNDPYSASTGRDVKGNIDVEVKLNRTGTTRLTLFSHSTDHYSNYLDDSQRTGMGIAYQHEFNSFKDLFRKKSAAQKEYEKLLRTKQREARKAERAARKAARKARRQK